MRVESAAHAHRRLVDELGGLPRRTLLDIEELLNGLSSRGPTPRELGQSAPGQGAPGQLAPGADRPSARLVAGIVAICASIEGRRVSVGDALRWFFGLKRSAAVFTEELEAARWGAEPDEQLAALLPYVLDPFGLTTRRALLRGQACGGERATRKRLGTFYTPGDVVRVLADEVITPETRHVLDPACGAGAFLRAAFTRLTSSIPPERAVERLHGVDIDAAAVDACALVLVHDWLMRQPLRAEELPADRFERVRSRLVCADALDLFAEPFQSRPLDGDAQTARASFPRYFDAILTNPPFARSGASSGPAASGYQALRVARDPAGVNMMWPFWELASRIVTRGGRIGIVLALSAAYSNGAIARATRRAVFGRGSWEMRFFDRSPDALFGDDVKQRVALALRRPGSPALLRTTGMRRWSVDRRAAALFSVGAGEGVDLPAEDGPVMKIGSATEREALERLRSLASTLGDATSDVRLASATGLDLGERAIAVAPTAYNWIGAFRDTAVARDARRHVAGKLAQLTFRSRVIADAAYGVIVSHVFLWWWRVTGDLFHVPLTVLTQAPFPIHKCSQAQLDALAAVGRRHWLSARDTPVAAVNKGVATVAYRAAADSDAQALVDRAVGEALGLAPEFVQFTRNDAARLRIAGRAV
jgi:hypothetical protein